MTDFRIKSNYNNELTVLAEKYCSDKGMTQESRDMGKSHWQWPAHKYTEIYSLLFNSIRLTTKNLLEVGIGTNNEDVKSSMGSGGTPGASLRMWRDYFINANIYGADIDERILFEEDRIKTFYLDQEDSACVNNTLKKINTVFDIIIDDGLHELNANITLLENSFSYLNDGGIYVIEDAAGYIDEITKYLNENGFCYYTFENLETYFEHNEKKGYISNIVAIIKNKNVSDHG